MNPENLSDKLMSIVADQARGTAELAATQRENLEHLKGLHDLARQDVVLSERIVERLEHMDDERERVTAEVRRDVAESARVLKQDHESIKTHVSAEVGAVTKKLEATGDKISANLKLLSAVIGFAATVIAAAIGFAAVWKQPH